MTIKELAFKLSQEYKTGKPLTKKELTKSKKAISYNIQINMRSAKRK